MRKIPGLLIMIFLLSGCAIHYTNEKGIKASASEIETRIGTIEDGNTYFWSTFELWIPWRNKG